MTEAFSTPTMSATVITLNEQDNIAACLESLSWVDEVIVVDSGSVDKTVAVAEGHGAKVSYRAWEGFSPQKNYALSLTSGDWVLHLDADERVPPALRDEILSTIRSPDAASGYFIPRKNHWLARPIMHGGWYPDYSLRLFRRGSARCEGLTHEQFMVDGVTARLQHPLLHYPYATVREHIEQILQSTPLDVEESLKNGVRVYRVMPWGVLAGLVGLLLKHGFDQLCIRLFYKERIRNRVEILWLMPFMPLIRFCYQFFFLRGFRDGVPGFWVAVFSAFYEAVRLAILWERLSGATVPTTHALRRSSRL